MCECIKRLHSNTVSFIGNNRNGTDLPDLSSVPGGEEMAGLWAQYHSALGLAKGKATPPATRDQSVSEQKSNTLTIVN